MTEPTHFDAPQFARAWLSVAQASGSDPHVPAIDRTVAIEHYPRHGVRLVATDRYVLLTAWVPEIAADHLAEPGLDEMPDRTIITRDLDARGKGLLAYVHRLAKRMARDVGDLPLGKIELHLTFDARLPIADGADVPFDGLESRYVVLEIPDTEQVYLDVMDAHFPDWRGIQRNKQPQAVDTIALHLDRLNGLAGLRQWNAGPITWTFQGAESCAFVDVQDSIPHVSGLVMPVRWAMPGDPEPESDSDDTQPRQSA